MVKEVQKFRQRILKIKIIFQDNKEIIIVDSADAKAVQKTFTAISKTNSFQRINGLIILIIL